MSQPFFAPLALLSNGWATNVTMEVEQGVFTRVQPNSQQPKNAVTLNGPVLPTVANLHSHAFQRVMAGVAEIASNPQDSFWSWRETMYRIVSSLTTEDLEIIASKLYIELLKGGYSQVGEFHYVHHQPDGKPYQQVTQLGENLIRAADKTGIGITLLPALYQYSGFGKQPSSEGQRRFIQSTEAYIEQHQQYRERLNDQPKHQLGICFHSLRATSFHAINTVLSQLHQNQPIHIHIAEQQKEVDDCIQWSGKRPVELLLEQCSVDQHWTLIHATHLNLQETTGLANSGAAVGICTTTEANLGDGIFPATEFEQAGGIWGVGSDSHVSTSLQEELRWFEYGQRLQQQKRNRLYGKNEPRVGNHLFHMALQGGNRACGVQLGLEVGNRADFMVWNDQLPFVRYSQPEDLINRWLFGLSESPIHDVYVAGEQFIRRSQHVMETEIDLLFGNLLQRIFAKNC